MQCSFSWGITHSAANSSGLPIPGLTVRVSLAPQNVTSASVVVRDSVSRAHC